MVQGKCTASSRYFGSAGNFFVFHAFFLIGFNKKRNHQSGILFNPAQAALRKFIGNSIINAFLIEFR
ncbi:MAG: hypothetical protein ACOCX8_04265 [Bacteroidota bacterium]